MTFREDVLRTWQSQSREMGICNASMGLAGETGELVDLFKKMIHHHHLVDPDKLVKEIGDVLYYLEVLCHYVGTTQDEAKARVIQKLRVRYPDGFDVVQSVNRDEGKE